MMMMMSQSFLSSSNTSSSSSSLSTSSSSQHQTTFLSSSFSQQEHEEENQQHQEEEDDDNDQMMQNDEKYKIKRKRKQQYDKEIFLSISSIIYTITTIIFIILMSFYYNSHHHSMNKNMSSTSSLLTMTTSNNNNNNDSLSLSQHQQQQQQQQRGSLLSSDYYYYHTSSRHRRKYSRRNNRKLEQEQENDDNAGDNNDNNNNDNGNNIDNYNKYSCNFIHDITPIRGSVEQCLFATTCNGGEGIMLANWIFCQNGSTNVLLYDILTIILIPILILYGIILFRCLGSTAEDYFSPSLEMLSVRCYLPPRFAGVTLLALGNGAADVSAAIASITSDPVIGYQMSLGALTGAAMFISTVISSIVILVSSNHDNNNANTDNNINNNNNTPIIEEGRVRIDATNTTTTIPSLPTSMKGLRCRGAFIRDVMALLITVITVYYELNKGYVNYESISLFLSIYLLFVITVLVADIYHRSSMIRLSILSSTTALMEQSSQACPIVIVPTATSPTMQQQQQYHPPTMIVPDIPPSELSETTISLISPPGRLMNAMNAATTVTNNNIVTTLPPPEQEQQPDTLMMGINNGSGGSGQGEVGLLVEPQQPTATMMMTPPLYATNPMPASILDNNGTLVPPSSVPITRTSSSSSHTGGIVRGVASKILMAFSNYDHSDNNNNNNNNLNNNARRTSLLADPMIPTNAADGSTTSRPSSPLESDTLLSSNQQQQNNNNNLWNNEERPITLHGLNGIISKPGHHHHRNSNNNRVHENDADMMNQYNILQDDTGDHLNVDSDHHNAIHNNTTTFHYPTTTDDYNILTTKGWYNMLYYGYYLELKRHIYDIIHDIYESDELHIIQKGLLYIELPLTIIRQMTVPIPCDGFYVKCMTSISILLSPIWISYYLYHNHDYNIWYNHYISMILYQFVSIIISYCIVRYGPLTDYENGLCPLPLYISVPIALYGFIIAATWIDTIADLLVNLLNLMGIVCYIPGPIIGLTVLAWGNSMGDLSANVTMARKGLSNMAITACYAGPVFNILMGLGFGFYGALQLQGDMNTDEHIISVQISKSVTTGFYSLMITSCCILYAGLIYGKGIIPYQYGYIALTLYTLYVIISITFQY